MSLDLLPCRGHVFRVSGASSNYADSAAFKLQPDLFGSGDSPIILNTLTVDDKIVNMPVLTLDSVRILYVFGKAWGDITVGGLALLGKGGTGDALAKVVEWFKANSVEKEDKEVSVSLPGGASYRFYVTALGIGDPDVEYQFFPFSVYGKIIE